MLEYIQKQQIVELKKSGKDRTYIAYYLDIKLEQVDYFLKSDHYKYMTENTNGLSIEQKAQVLEMRDRGCGYRTIANDLGVDRNKVRDFCRTKYADRAGYIGGNPGKQERECKECKAKFIPQKNELFCNKNCKVKHAETMRKLKLLTKKLRSATICPTCGKVFFKKTNQIYCNDECRYEYRNCNVCGKLYKVRRDLDTKTCSRKCTSELITMNHSQYMDQLISIHKGLIVPTEMYIGGEKPMTMLCLRCNRTTTKAKASGFIYSSHTGKPTGCKYCDRVISKGEDAIQTWLDENNIHYKSQWQTEDLKMDAPLRMDFAVLDSNDEAIAFIEYDGRQHHTAVDCFGGNDGLERQQKSDDLKNQYAFSHGILMIRISHKQKQNIHVILDKHYKQGSFDPRPYAIEA